MDIVMIIAEVSVLFYIYFPSSGNDFVQGHMTGVSLKIVGGEIIGDGGQPGRESMTPVLIPVNGFPRFNERLLCDIFGGVLMPYPVKDMFVNAVDVVPVKLGERGSIALDGPANQRFFGISIGHLELLPNL